MAESQETTSTIAESSQGVAVSLDLSILPPVFVLPTRLDLSHLHATEDLLVRAGAPLTYDVSEAKLVLGAVGTKRRADFELRCRRLWTEEIPRQTEVSRPSIEESRISSTPAKKKRRIEAPTKDVRNDKDAVIIQDSDSSTASEAETWARHAPEPAEGPNSHPSAADTGYESAAEELALPPFTPADFANSVKVVKLEWLTRSVEENKILPLDPYLVYEGHAIARPEKASTPPPPIGGGATARTSQYRKPDVGKGILDRAKGEASNTPEGGTSRYTPAWKSHQRGPSAGHTVTRPTQLLHQTTSEHDEGVSSTMPEMPDWVKKGVKYACQRSANISGPNKDFIEQLKTIRTARLLTADEIGVRAYSTSIAALAAYPREITSTREVLALPGCDTKIAHLFHEWQTTGSIKAVRDIESDETLTTLRLFYDIWGVGAATARDFYYGRGWRDLDDVVEYGWSTLSRVQQIGVKYYDEFLDPIPRPEVAAIGASVLQHARAARDGGVEAIIVGGYRRGKAASGDVDIVLSHRDEAATLFLVRDVVDRLEAAGAITHTLLLSLTGSRRDQQPLPFRAKPADAPSGAYAGAGFDTLDKALVVWQDPSPSSRPAGLNPPKNNAPHRRLDIIVTPWRTVGCAVVGWSGGTTFQRDLRRYAKATRGWKFDSSGVRDRASGEWVDLEGWDGPQGEQGRANTMEEAEKRVFAGLGLEWREPWERCTG